MAQISTEIASGIGSVLHGTQHPRAFECDFKTSYSERSEIGAASAQPAPPARTEIT